MSATAPRDPFQPSTPTSRELGRLVTVRAIRPGWPCRHCDRGLVFLRRPGIPSPAAVIICPNCDNPTGVTAP